MNFKDYTYIVFFLSEDIRDKPKLIIKYLKKFLKPDFRWMVGQKFNESNYFEIVGEKTLATTLYAEKNSNKDIEKYKITFSRHDFDINLVNNPNIESFEKLKTKVIVFLEKDKINIWINKNEKIIKKTISNLINDKKIFKTKKLKI